MPRVRVPARSACPCKSLACTRVKEHGDIPGAGTGGRVLVEASPRDRIWGIGLAAGDEQALSPERWPGLNLLGFALMEVRHQLRA